MILDVWERSRGAFGDVGVSDSVWRVGANGCTKNCGETSLNGDKGVLHQLCSRLQRGTQRTCPHQSDEIDTSNIAAHIHTYIHITEASFHPSIHRIPLLHISILTRKDGSLKIKRSFGKCVDAKMWWMRLAEPTRGTPFNTTI